MREEKLGKLLNELAQRTVEPVSPGLAEDIKHQIPHGLIPHRGGMDTVNIIIDLRVSKLAAAAVIIATMILCANFLGGRDFGSNGIYQDGRLLARYLLGSTGAGKSNILAGRAKYEYLVHRGKEIVFYGDSIDPEDSNAVLMQWKLSDGKYQVVFGDLHEREVDAEELIKLQARMLQKKAKR
jgi:hypothetical protein